jgi:hypothetical protein
MALFLDPIAGQKSAGGTHASISGNGSVVSGTAAPASSIAVHAVDGTQLAAGKAGADGSFILRLGSAQTNGEKLLLSSTPQDGGKAEAIDLVAPDFTGPHALEEVDITSDGNFVYGTGAVPGEPVRVMAGSTMLGYALAEADGSFNVELAEAQINAQSLKVYAFDAMGNASEPFDFTCPDYTIPAAEGVRISGNGAFIEGQTEPFARIAVSSEPDPFASNVFLATVGDGYADAKGRFFMQLKQPAINGETIFVAVADQAKNCSRDILLKAPDLQQPDAPQTTVLQNNGSTISGIGEPGTEAIATDANGQVVATAIVSGKGTFEIELGDRFQDGDLVDISLIDEAGNLSAPVSVTLERMPAAAAPSPVAPATPVAQPEEAAAPVIDAPVAQIAEAQTAVETAQEPAKASEEEPGAVEAQNTTASNPAPVVEAAEAPATEAKDAEPAAQEAAMVPAGSTETQEASDADASPRSDTPLTPNAEPETEVSEGSAAAEEAAVAPAATQADALVAPESAAQPATPTVPEQAAAPAAEAVAAIVDKPVQEPEPVMEPVAEPQVEAQGAASSQPAAFVPAAEDAPLPESATLLIEAQENFLLDLLPVAVVPTTEEVETSAKLPADTMPGESVAQTNSATENSAVESEETSIAANPSVETQPVGEAIAAPIVPADALPLDNVAATADDSANLVKRSIYTLEEDGFGVELDLAAFYGETQDAPVERSASDTDDASGDLSAVLLSVIHSDTPRDGDVQKPVSSFKQFETGSSTSDLGSAPFAEMMREFEVESEIASYI